METLISKIDIKRLVRKGTLVPHPKWTKKQILKHASQMYREVEALRKYIIDKKV